MHHAIFVSKKIHSLSCFSSQREFLYVSGKEIILTGYFNINMPIEESSRKHLLTKGLKCMHFDQQVTDVTRLVSGSCLDHVYANRSKNTERASAKLCSLKPPANLLRCANIINYQRKISKGTVQLSTET